MHLSEPFAIGLSIAWVRLGRSRCDACRTWSSSPPPLLPAGTFRRRRWPLRLLPVPSCRHQWPARLLPVPPPASVDSALPARASLVVSEGGLQPPRCRIGPLPSTAGNSVDGNGPMRGIWALKWMESKLCRGLGPPELPQRGISIRYFPWGGWKRGYAARATVGADEIGRMRRKRLPTWMESKLCGEGRPVLSTKLPRCG